MLLPLKWEDSSPLNREDFLEEVTFKMELEGGQDFRGGDGRRERRKEVRGGESGINKSVVRKP